MRDISQTQLLEEPGVSAIWLEYTPPDGGPAQKAPLEQLPFFIGRAESSHLQIDSTRVSRKHAVVECQHNNYQLRDLGSTNGTFVNGRKVSSQVLNHGDIIVIADVQINFFKTQDNLKFHLATKMMDTAVAQDDDVDQEEKKRSRNFLSVVRTLQEMLLHCSPSIFFQKIVQLEREDVFGYEACWPQEFKASIAPETAKTVLEMNCRLGGRLHLLQRVLAVEEAALELPSCHLFLNVSSEELGSVGLVGEIHKLHAMCRGKQTLVVQIPHQVDGDMSSLTSILSHLKKSNVPVALTGIFGSLGRTLKDLTSPPNFFRLAPALMHGIAHSSDRQRQVEELVRAIQKLGCKVIATGVGSAAEAKICLDLGCRFAQGKHFGQPQPIHLCTDGHSIGQRAI